MPSASIKPLTTISTVEAAKALGGRRTEYPDTKVPGLALRVTPAGAKSWTLRYRTAEAKQRRLNLGGFPAVGLSKAREEATKALGVVAGGSDPAGAKQAARAAAKSRKAETVEDLIDAYLEAAERGTHRPNARPKRAGTMGLDRYYFEKHIRPSLGRVSVADLTRAEVQRLLDDVGAKAPSTARHCRAVLRQAYNFAIRNELAKGNPASLTSLAAPAQRDRVLSETELRAIWSAASPEATTGLAIRLAMLTLQRGGEVTGMQASELDREARLWTIPGTRTKNHRTHVVPLSDDALSVIDAAYRLTAARVADRSGQEPPAVAPWRGPAFPSRAGAKAPTLRRDSVSKALRRLCPTIGVTDATPHDFRRTGATAITSERIGIPRFIVSRVINQISDTGGAATVTAIYDRNEYLADKRRALGAWGSLLMEVVEDRRRDSNVTRLLSSRAG